MDIEALRRMSGAQRFAIAMEMTKRRKALCEARLRRFRPNLTDQQLREMRIHHAQRKTAREIEMLFRVRRSLNRAPGHGNAQ